MTALTKWREIVTDGAQNDCVSFEVFEDTDPRVLNNRRTEDPATGSEINEIKENSARIV